MFRNPIKDIFEKYITLPFSLENLSYASKVLIEQKKISWSTNKNPTSSPFISGDSFAAISDHNWNSAVNDINPVLVKQNDVVFVNSGLLHYFFLCIHPFIRAPYILLSSNGDENIGSQYYRYIDRNIIQWFAQNVTNKHSKITPIPIGLENLKLQNHGVTNRFISMKKTRFVKRSKILASFSTHTNVIERAPAAQTLSQLRTTLKTHERLNAMQYEKLLSTCMFVASPPGNGIDCHRTWEALELGVIPIVKRSVAMDSFASRGLPIWIIDEWTELNDYTEKDLSERYAKMTKTAKYDALRMEYWEREIEKYRI